MGLIIGSKLRQDIMRSYRGGHLNCKDLLDILENKISPGAMRGRNKLVKILSEADSHSNRRAHTVGSADQTMHYTIFIDGRGYHLRLDQNGIVFQITDYKALDLGGVPPWVPPGAIMVK